MSNIRKIRRIALGQTKISKDIELMRALAEILELTHMAEIDLLSVGAKAEKEQRTMGY